MVDSLGALLRQRGEEGKEVVSEGIARGILSISSGYLYSVEELAEEINISSDLIESSVLMAKIKGN